MSRKRNFEIDIDEIQKYYEITEDGRVYSKIKNRWLHPIRNNFGYTNYSINKGIPHSCFISAHRLVAFKYLGPPPNSSYEVDHKDHDKTNNHWSNLQWVTHAENIRRSFAENGREGYWKNKIKPSPDLLTRDKMSNAKKKTVIYEKDGIIQKFQSIDDAARELNTYRKRIYLSIKNSVIFNGGKLKYENYKI